MCSSDLNVGKSSLLNALAGSDVAIVTPIAGTTRDKITETIQVEGIPINIIDTAGIRNDAEADGEVERIDIAAKYPGRIVELPIHEGDLVQAQRIDVYRDRPIRGHHVTHTRYRARANGVGHANCPGIDDRVDHGREFDEDPCVTDAAHTDVIETPVHRPSACRSFWWMPPKPPFDITRTTSPSVASRATVSTMPSTSGT